MIWFSKDVSAGHSARKKVKRQTKKCREENFKEWTGMKFAHSTGAAEDRTGIVVNSSVVPQRPHMFMG